MKESVSDLTFFCVLTFVVGLTIVMVAGTLMTIKQEHEREMTKYELDCTCGTELLPESKVISYAVL
jgi:hypothetical protein